MSDCGKTEDTLPKAKSASPSSDPGDTIGLYRFQKYDDGSIHVHDKDKRFCFKNARAFHLAFTSFLSSIGTFKPNSVVVFPGDKSDPGSGRTACDLALVFKGGHWNINLMEDGLSKATAVLGDSTITWLDEWTQRKC